MKDNNTVNYKNYKNYIKSRKTNNFETNDVNMYYEVKLNIVKEESLKGQAIELNLNQNIREQWIDVELDSLYYLRFYGTVKGLNGEKPSGIKVTLYKTELINYKTEYIPVCDVITSEEGIFEGIIYAVYGKNHYVARVTD